MRFSRLLEWTGAQLRALDFAEVEVPEEFARRSGKAELSLQSRCWYHPLGTEAKCAYLFGPRAEVLNLMIYPRNALRVPIFAVEMILFGQQPRVAVVDLQPAAGLAHDESWSEQIATALDELPHAVRAALPPGGELPEWAVSHFSRSCIYSRPTDMRQLAPVYSGYRSFFRIWARRFFLHEGPLSGEQHLAHYQAHHVASTPGRKFLHTSFGVPWTESFLADFMYTSRPLASLPS